MKKNCIYTWNGKQYSEEAFKNMIESGAIHAPLQIQEQQPLNQQKKGFYNRIKTKGLKGFEALTLVSRPQFNIDLVSRETTKINTVLNNARDVFNSIIGSETKRLMQMIDDIRKNPDNLAHPETNMKNVGYTDIQLLIQIREAYGEMYNIFNSFRESIRQKAHAAIDKETTDIDKRINLKNEFDNKFNDTPLILFIEKYNENLPVTIKIKDTLIQIPAEDTSMIALMPELYRLMGGMSELAHEIVLAIAEEEGIEMDSYQLAELANRKLGASIDPDKPNTDYSDLDFPSTVPNVAIIELAKEAIGISQSLASMALFFNRMQMQMASRQGLNMVLVREIYNATSNMNDVWSSYMQMQSILAERFGQKREKRGLATKVLNAVTEAMDSVKEKVKEIGAEIQKSMTKGTQNDKLRLTNLDKAAPKEQRKLLIQTITSLANLESKTNDESAKLYLKEVRQIIKDNVLGWSNVNEKTIQKIKMELQMKLGFNSDATTVFGLVKDISDELQNKFGSLQQKRNLADPYVTSGFVPNRQYLIDEYVYQLSKYTDLLASKESSTWSINSIAATLKEYKKGLSSNLSKEEVDLIMNNIATDLSDISKSKNSVYKNAVDLGAKAFTDLSAEMIDELLEDISGEPKLIIRLDPSNKEANEERFNQFKKLLIAKGREILNKLDAKERQELGIPKRTKEVDNLEVLAYLMRNQDALISAFNAIKDKVGSSNDYLKKLEKLSIFMLDSEINKVLNQVIEQTKRYEPEFNLNNEAFTREKYNEWCETIFNTLTSKGISVERANLAVLLFQSAYEGKMNVITNKPIEQANLGVIKAFENATTINSGRVDILRTMLDYAKSETVKLIELKPGTKPTTLDYIKVFATQQAKAKEIYETVLKKMEDIYGSMPPNTPESNFLLEMRKRSVEQRIMYIKKALVAKYFNEKINQLDITMANEAFTQDDYLLFKAVVMKDVADMGISNGDSFIERMDAFYNEEVNNVYTNTSNVVSKKIIELLNTTSITPNKTVKSALSSALLGSIKQVASELGIRTDTSNPNELMYKLSLILRTPDSWTVLKKAVFMQIKPDLIANGIDPADFENTFDATFSPMVQMVSDKTMRQVMKKLLETYNDKIREAAASNEYTDLLSELRNQAIKQLQDVNPNLTKAEIASFIKQIENFVAKDAVNEREKAAAKIADKFIDSLSDKNPEVSSIYKEMIQAVASQFEKITIKDTKKASPKDILSEQIDKAARILANRGIYLQLFKDAQAKAISMLNQLLNDGKIDLAKYTEEVDRINSISPNKYAIIDRATVNKIMMNAFRSIPGFATKLGGVDWGNIIRVARVVEMYGLDSNVDERAVANKIMNSTQFATNLTVREMLISALKDRGIPDDEIDNYIEAFEEILGFEVHKAITDFQKKQVMNVSISEINPNKDLLTKTYSMLRAGVSMDEILNDLEAKLFGTDSLIYTPEQRKRIVDLADLIQAERAKQQAQMAEFENKYRELVDKLKKAEIANDTAEIDRINAELYQLRENAATITDGGATGYTLTMLMQEHALMLVEPSPLLNYQLFVKALYTSMLSSIETFSLNMIEFITSTVSTIIADAVRTKNLDYMVKRFEMISNAWRVGLSIAFNGYSPFFDTIDKDLSMATPIMEVFKTFTDNPIYKANETKKIPYRRFIAASWLVGKYFSRYIMAVNIINSYMQQDYAWLKMQHEKYKRGEITKDQWELFLHPTQTLKNNLIAKATAELNAIDAARAIAGKKPLSKSQRTRLTKIIVGELEREYNQMEDQANSIYQNQSVVESQFNTNNPDVQNAVMQMTRKMLSYQTSPAATFLLGLFPLPNSIMFNIANVIQSAVKATQRPELLIDKLYDKNKNLTFANMTVVNTLYGLSVSVGTIFAFAKTTFGVMEYCYQSTIPVFILGLAKIAMRLVKFGENPNNFNKLGGGYLTRYALAAYGDSKVITDYYLGEYQKGDKTDSDLNELRQQNIEVLAHANYLEVTQAELFKNVALLTIILLANQTFISDDDDELEAIKIYLRTQFDFTDEAALNFASKFIVGFNSMLPRENVQAGLSKRPLGTVRIGNSYFNADMLGSTFSYISKTFGLLNDYMRASDPKIYDNMFSAEMSNLTENQSYSDYQENLALKIAVTGLLSNPISLTPLRTTGSTISRLMNNPEQTAEKFSLEINGILINSVIGGFNPSSGFVRSIISLVDDKKKISPREVGANQVLMAAGLNTLLPNSYNIIGDEISKFDIFPSKMPGTHFLTQNIKALAEKTGIMPENETVNPEQMRFFNKYANSVKITQFMDVKVEDAQVDPNDTGKILKQRMLSEYELSGMQLIRGKVFKAILNGQEMHVGTKWLDPEGVIDGGNEISMDVIKDNPNAAQKLLKLGVGESNKRASYIMHRLIDKRLSGADLQIEDAIERGYGEVNFYIGADGLIEASGSDANYVVVEEILKNKNNRELLTKIYNDQKKRDKIVP